MNRQSLGKRLLAMTLCMALLLSCILIAGVSAALTGNEFLKEDFESNPWNTTAGESGTDAEQIYKTSGGGNNVYRNSGAIGALLSTGTGAGADGSSDGYMLLKHDGSSTTYPAAFRIFGTEFVQKVGSTTVMSSDFKGVKNTNYRVTFRYKVVSVDSTAKLQVYYGSLNWGNWNNTSYGGQTYTDTAKMKQSLDLTAADADSTWKTYSTVLNTGSVANGWHIGLVGSGEVHIDDVVLEYVTGTRTIVSYMLDATTSIDTTVTNGWGAEVGASIFLPTVAKEGCSFDGWYYDAACESQVSEGDTLAAETTALYAKFTEDILSLKGNALVSADFESPPVTGIAVSDQTTLSKTEAYSTDTSSGNNVITAAGGGDIHALYVCEKGAGSGYGGSDGYMELVHNGSTSSDRPVAGFRIFGNAWRSSIDGTLLMRAGSNGKGSYYERGIAEVTYRVSFMYKVVEMNGTVGLNVYYGGLNWSTTSSGVTGARTKQTWTLTSADADGAWHRYEAVFHTDEASSWHIGIQDTNDGKTSKVLIDNVTVDYVPPKADGTENTVAVSYVVGDSTATFNGEIGTTIFRPHVALTGYTFDGWYHDEAYTDPVEDTDTYTADTTTLYAKLTLAAGISYIAFETNGGEAIETMSGAAGAAVTLPAPTRTGHVFKGWYTDEALTEEYTAGTFPTEADKTLTLYAKWQETTVSGKTNSFETLEVGTSVNVRAGTSATAVVSTDQAHTGSNSVKYHQPAGGSTNGNNRIQIPLTDADGKMVYPEYGKTYILSFWVYEETIEKDLVTFWVATSNNGTAFTVSADTANATTYAKDNYRIGGQDFGDNRTAQGQWVNITKVLTVENRVQATGQLMLGLVAEPDSTNNKYATEQTFYLDDVTVISFDNGLGSLTKAYQYISGGKDNSSLAATAGENSAVYTNEDGAKATAFRVGATYTTDSVYYDTVLLGGVSYPIKERGLIVGREGSKLTTATTTKTSVTSGFDSQYWSYDAPTGEVTYTMLVKNVTDDKARVNYIARAYMVVTIDGTDYTIYTNTSDTFTAEGFYATAKEQITAEGGTAPVWFTEDELPPVTE